MTCFFAALFLSRGKMFRKPLSVLISRANYTMPLAFCLVMMAPCVQEETTTTMFHALRINVSELFMSQSAIWRTPAQPLVRVR